MEFLSHRLPNGLEIVCEANPQAYSAAYGFFVKTGSRDENDQISGVSHFLEHMVFKGTPKRSAAEVNLQLDDLSSQSNAYTSEEQTVYYATTLPEDQEPLLELLADIMRPALREDDFNTEKQVILEEIAKYEDQPPYNAHEKLLALLLGSHPLAHSVLGTVKTVGDLSRDQMLAYFERRYSPSNIVLAAAGAVDFPKLIKQVESICGQWRAFDAPRETPAAKAVHQTRVIHKPQAAQEYVILGALGPAANDEDRYAARVLSTILGDDSGSRLFWELVDTGKAEYASLSLQEFQGTGVYMTGMSCEPGLAAENLDTLREIFATAEKENVRDDELTQAKNKICAHLVLQAERPTSRMFSVGHSWIQRRQYRTIREAVDSYRAVELADLARVLKRFPLSQFATVAVGPLEKLES
jgi:predicted Zn-dependent peptidase